MRIVAPLILLPLLAAGCGRMSEVGRAPSFSPVDKTGQYHAMYSLPLPESAEAGGTARAASLWNGGPESLLGDRRASQRGDILTVVIEIDDKAEISNSSGRSRSGSEKMAIPQLFGLPQRLAAKLPDGAGLDPAVDLGGESSYKGNGSVQRKEKLTLRVAATVVETLPNGVLRIEGSQEVRVNFELRELVVTGFVRPSDISRQNEITYDKIAGARIAYGGRGQITDVQQPRYGQQISDIILPF